MTAEDVKKDLKSNASKDKALVLQRFFKTGPGQYGHGDIFLGIQVPKTRMIAKKHAALSLAQVKKLLHSKIHEERLCALMILVHQFERGDEATREKIFNFYVANFSYVNNWDLVDLSAPKIVGAYLYEIKDDKILQTWAKSEHLWTKRISIISTLYFIKKDSFQNTLKICRLLMNDKHDLIHKACGWMLREMGKQNEEVLCGFLDKYAHKLPRTALRYSLERLSEKKRKSYMIQK